MKKKILYILFVIVFGFCFISNSLILNKIAYASKQNSVVFDPVAKYEFLDQDNPGKDSVGNYDLITKVSDGFSEGAVNVNDGVITFDGTAGLAAPQDNDISDSLVDFTLCFEIKHQGSSDWKYPIGFGWDGHNRSKFFGFNVIGSEIRFNDWNVDATDYSITATEPYWQHLVGGLSTEGFSKLILSVQPGGNLNLYFDGELKVSYNVSENFTLNDEVMTFGIGGLSMWGNIYEPYVGSIKNVEIYDFAFDSIQALEYYDVGNISTSLLVKNSISDF